MSDKTTAKATAERKFVQAIAKGHLEELQRLGEPVPKINHAVFTTWDLMQRFMLLAGLSPERIAKDMREHQTFTGHAAPGTGHDFGRELFR